MTEDIVSSKSFESLSIDLDKLLSSIVNLSFESKIDLKIIHKLEEQESIERNNIIISFSNVLDEISIQETEENCIIKASYDINKETDKQMVKYFNSINLDTKHNTVLKKCKKKYH